MQQTFAAYVFVTNWILILSGMSGTKYVRVFGVALDSYNFLIPGAVLNLAILGFMAQAPADPHSQGKTLFIFAVAAFALIMLGSWLVASYENWPR